MAYKYPKPWRDHDQLLNLLSERGMRITDRKRALSCLERFGYYRLSGYWYPFRERSDLCCPLADKSVGIEQRAEPQRLALDNFKMGTTFEGVVGLYVFDKRLRLLAMDALERIEVAVRANVAHTLGKIDPFAYLKPDLLHEKFSIELKRSGVAAHHQWLGKHARLIDRSKEEFIRHNRRKYGLPLAIWVACEVWDFGTLSKLFSGLREGEQDEISSYYGVTNGRVFASWLRSLNHLRNICAHHSRLWNRNIVDQPKLPSNDRDVKHIIGFTPSDHEKARCFLLLKIVKHLMGVISPDSTWAERLKAHLEDFPAFETSEPNLAAMGVPEDWKNIWFEQDK